MSAQVSGYAVGTRFEFDIYEDDAPFGRTYVDTKFGNVFYSASSNGYFVAADWTTVWQADGIGDPEFHFDVTDVSVPNGLGKRSSDPEITVARRSNRVPTTPGSVSISNISKTSATMSWGASSDADGDTITYEVQYGINNTLGWNSLPSTTSRSSTITGLTPNTTYVVRVRATDGKGGISNWNELDPAFTTLPNNRPPSSPGQPKADKITTSSAVISWDASTDADGDLISYDLYYARAFTLDNWTLVPGATTSTSKTISGLLSDQLYSVRVVARDGMGGESSNASTAAFKTLEGTITFRNGKQPSASLSTEIKAGQIAYLRFDAPGWSDQIVDVEVWEKDSISDDYITTVPVQISNGVGFGEWEASWQGDDGSDPNNEYYAFFNGALLHNLYSEGNIHVSVGVASGRSFDNPVTFDWDHVRPIEKDISVTLTRLDPDGASIDPHLPTWMVIHGRTDSFEPGYMLDLAKAVDASTGSYQVLTLDWAEGAGAFSDWFDYSGEQWIKPVANWAAQLLTASGFDLTDFNIVGHSWGGVMSAEVSDYLKGVNRIVALDPAEDAPTLARYDTSNVNFSSNSKYSWAFLSSEWGSAKSAATADASFKMDVDGNAWALIPAHTDARNLFTAMLSASQGPAAGGVSAMFSLTNVNDSGAIWADSKFALNGLTGEVAEGVGKFEGILYATESGGVLTPLALRYNRKDDGLFHFIFERQSVRSVAPSLLDGTTTVTVRVRNDTGKTQDFLILPTTVPVGWTVKALKDRNLLGDCNPTIVAGATYDALFAVTASVGTSTGDIVWTLLRDDLGDGNPLQLGELSQHLSTVSVDITPPLVTINRAASQSDPTSDSLIHFTVEFSEAVIGFTGGDVVLSGTALGSLVARVTGSGTTYDVAVSGMTGDGTVIASIPAGVAKDASNNGNLASTSSDHSVTYQIVDVTQPTVTITRAVGQGDPTNSSTINFRVVFSEPVTGFATGDVILSGTAPGVLVGTVTGSETTYNVAVSGMSGSGTVIASIPAGVAKDAAANVNSAGKVDAVVNFEALAVDVVAPSVTINQVAAQSDPTSVSPIHFTVVFSEAVTGFTGSDVVLSGTAPGMLAATVTGGGTTYDVAVAGMSGSGSVIASIPARVASDSALNGNLASTSTDNSVTYQLVDVMHPTVTITKAAGQGDPASSSTINFTVVFSEPVTGFNTGDVTLTGTAPGILVGTVSGSGTTYTVAVTGMSGDGTVIATIDAGKCIDAAGNPNEAATNAATVTYQQVVSDTIPPTVTINQLSSQGNPTSNSSIRFSVTFSEAVTGFTGSDVVLSGTAPGTLLATVTGSGTSYDIAITGMSGDGTVIASIPAGAAKDAAGNDSLTSTSTDNSVTYQAVNSNHPTVMITKSAGQGSPTSDTTIHFTVVFSEPVTGFTTGDVTLSGTAGATTATVGTSSDGGRTYNVAVTGMSSDGTVIVTIGAGKCTDAAGNPNNAAPSAATVTYQTVDTTHPTVTITKASGQSDPTSGTTINFTVIFSEPVTGFTTGKVTLAGTAPGTLVGAVTGSGTTYNVAVTGMTGSGTVAAMVVAGQCTDAAGNFNDAALSGANVTYQLVLPDTTPPTVTLNQANSQSDPTSSSPIHFTVIFSEPVFGFTGGDVLLAGTAPGTLVATLTGSGTTYDVSVSGMTGNGTVVASIPAGVATDVALNGNLASSSTDYAISYQTTEVVPPGTGTGLLATYFDNRDFSGKTLTRADPTIGFDWNVNAPVPGVIAPETYSVRWEGEIQAAEAGQYLLQTYADDGVRVWLSGSLVINNWSDHWATIDTSMPITFAAGQKMLIKVEYYNNSKHGVVKLSWQRPQQSVFEVIPTARLYSSSANGSTTQLSTSGATIIQAEDFITGGEGTGYHDEDVINLGGEYRPKEGVDLQKVSNDTGSFNVGWTKAGEWLEYSVNVPAGGGKYNLDARVASLAGGGSFHVSVGGVNVASFAIPSTGNWQHWVTTPARTIDLPAGLQVIRIVFGTNSSNGWAGNLNWIRFTPLGISTSNLAFGKPAVSSSNETSGLAPSNLTDGSTSTRWSSAFSDPQWVYVDLGQSHQINHVVMNWETAFSKSFQVQVSEDALNWTPIYTTSSGTGGVEDLTGLSGSGRYVRMFGTQRGTQWGYSLWEIEVYGS